MTDQELLHLFDEQVKRLDERIVAVEKQRDDALVQVAILRGALFDLYRDVFNDDKLPAIEQARKALFD